MSASGLSETARRFPHIAIIWNSCNFYTLVASRNPANVARFCRLFYPPYIPDRCVFLAFDTPVKARGLDGVELSFRIR